MSKNIKLWVDDRRLSPEGWYHALSSAEAIDYLWHARELQFYFEAISLDHDLGGEDTTRKVVLWMIENDYWPQNVYVHTSNPVGREWLVGMVNQYGPGISYASFLTIT